MQVAAACLSAAYLVLTSYFFLLAESEELLQTNLQNSKTNHFDSNNSKKSLVINGNSNCSLIDEKPTIQSGKCD